MKMRILSTFVQIIDETAALKSASYGMFQVMGFNYELAGFGNVYEMVESLKV